MSQPTISLSVEAFLALRVYRRPEILHNYANLKKLPAEKLRKMFESDHTTPTTKGLVYAVMQSRKPPTKSRLPQQQFVCV